MFKRVEKRRRKREEEEELGLDDDMKEVLGIHDTDSEESDSNSDESLSSDDAFSEGDQEGPDNDHTEQALGDYVDASGSENEEPAITVQEALRDPVYLISLQPEVKACIVCPGKLLKGKKMVAIHHISNAHARRFNQFRALVEKASPTANAWDIVRQNAESKPKILSTPISNSKRAEKRKAKAAAHKEQRQKQKAKAKARKAAVVQESTTSPICPPKKKHKVKEPSPAPKIMSSVHSTENTKVTSTEPTIKSIVRSTSVRSKQELEHH